MSTPWRCAVCETVNEGGEACAACGAPRTQSTTAAPPSSRTPARPARKPPRQQERQTEIPVRRLPDRRPAAEPSDCDDGYDLDPHFDPYFDAQAEDEADDRYARDEDVDVRPRVQVFGCCLPLALGLLLAVVGAATLLVNRLIQAV